MGRIDSARVEHHYNVIRTYGLQSHLPSGMNVQEWLEVMARDKKAIDGLTFILDGPNGLETVSPVAQESVVEALNRMTSKS
jgi:5-deoxy-5-amino-3-dehydroquinate synthase